MSKKRVLVIDDSATVRMYHRSVLEAAGYEVSEAINGIEALEKALAVQEPFDLYIVDINMPKMDGYSFLRQLRQQPIPQVPAIVVSTESKTHDKAQAYEAGANFYLVKPIRPDDLVAYVCLLIGQGGHQ